MEKLKWKLEGDIQIWIAIISLILFFSLPAIYSTSSNIVYNKHADTTFGFLMKHLVKIVVGLAMLLWLHKRNVITIKKWVMFLLPLSVLLLVVAMAGGTTIGGANASRWIFLPFGLSFQPSHLAWISVLLFGALIFSKEEIISSDPKIRAIIVWGPISLVVVLIFFSNLSTALMIYVSYMFLLYVARYSIKTIIKVNGSLLLGLLMVVLVVKAFPDSEVTKSLPSRATTWVARMDRFFASEDNEKVDLWQISNAKIAIAQGELTGVGYGKSLQKNVLPQASSDFVFAIITEEMGLVRAVGLILLYFWLFYRIVKLAIRSQKKFNKFVVMGLGFSIIMQAIVNIGVNVDLLPTTGQPLPLISAGGTSILMTCFSLGIILAVSRDESLLNSKGIKKKKNNKSQNSEEVEVNPLSAIVE